MIKRKFSDEEGKEIYRQYYEGEVSTLVLAERYRCSYTAIINAIRRSGGKLRSLKEAHNTDSCKQLLRQNNSVVKGEMCGENHPLYRMPRSDNVKRKLSIKNKGQKSWNNGLTKETDERVRSISETKSKCTGKNTSFYGKHHSEAAKQKMREKALQRTQINVGPFKDTKPELKMKEILNELNIPFKHQFRLSNHLYDFHILNTNILIEVDGDYWHGNPLKFKKLNKIQRENKQRDIKHNEIVKENNYTLLRFWEKDILYNTEKVKKELVIL